MNFPRRGEIWLVRLDPVVGHEIAKTRPAVVISNDRNNEFSSTVSVLPVTSNIKQVYPFETLLKREDANILKDSKVKSDQIRTLDKKRLVKSLGKLQPDNLREVERSLLIHLGFIS